MSRVFCSSVHKLPNGLSGWAASPAQEAAPDVETAGKMVSLYSRSHEALAASRSGSVGYGVQDARMLASASSLFIVHDFTISTGSVHMITYTMRYLLGAAGCSCTTANIAKFCMHFWQWPKVSISH